MPNLSDEYADFLNTHTFNLLRVSAGMRQKVVGMLEELEAVLLARLQLAAGKSALSVARLNALLKQTRQAIATAYRQINTYHAGEMRDLAQLEAELNAKWVNTKIGATVMSVALNETQLEAVADKTLVLGLHSKEWWEKQSVDLQDKFAAQMRTGYLMGETIDELVARVRGHKAVGYADGLLLTSRRNAENLVRTSIINLSNSARTTVYEQNLDIVKGIQWIATIDKRTCPVCGALDGNQWSLPNYEPIGDSASYPGNTAHWSCRCTQIAVLRSWEELAGTDVVKGPRGGKVDELEDGIIKQAKENGRKMDAIDKQIGRTRASMDGQIAASTTYEKWLGGKSAAEQDAILGPGRGSLFRAGKATLADMTSQDNRPLTIQQIRDAIK